MSNIDETHGNPWAIVVIALGADKHILEGVLTEEVEVRYIDGFDGGIDDRNRYIEME